MTNEPSGNTRRLKRILPRRNPNRRGPMPRPSSEAATLHERAASRWPNSCTIMASAVNPISEIINPIGLEPDYRVSRPMPGVFLRKLETTSEEVTEIVTYDRHKKAHSFIRFLCFFVASGGGHARGGRR